MKTRDLKRGAPFDRRAFLRGAGAVAVGLPFLEGMPERSAWSATTPPVFTFFVVMQNGVVGSRFFPDAVGPLTLGGLGDASDKATSALASHANHLLFIKGINYPQIIYKGCGHAEALCQTLTGVLPGSTGNKAFSGGPSADTLIGQALDAEPLALYAGPKGFIAERLSFKAAGAGQTRAADANPYLLYAKVVGLANGSTSTSIVDPVAQELVATRKSVNDLVRNELQTLLARPELSKADRQRLQQHFQAIRDVEVKMTAMAGEALTCSTAGLPTDSYEMLKDGFAFKGSMMEDVANLHLQMVALAFACNYSRIGTFQWGDGKDSTIYDVASNASLGWTFHQLSHRLQSDSISGTNPLAEAGHHEVDCLRMRSLATCLDAFKAHGLENSAQIVWMNSIADGPTHSGKDVPMIIWGSGGGKLKQGVFVDAGGILNGKVLNTLVASALADQAGPPPVLTQDGLFPGMMA